MEQSDSLAYAAFESNWTTLPEKIKKKLIFLVMKCEKPLKISALTLFHLSIETFVKVIKICFLNVLFQFCFFVEHKIVIKNTLVFNEYQILLIYFLQILRTAWSYFALLRQVNAPAVQ